MRVGQTSIIVFISKILSSALGFVATIYFARVLGAEVLGYFSATLALVSWLKLAGDLGISNAVRKRISEGQEASEYATAGTVAIVAIAIVLSVLVVVFDDAVAAYVGRPVAIAVVVLLAAQLVQSLVSSLLEGERKVHISGALEPVKTGVRSMIQIGLVFAGFGLAGLLAGQAIGWFLASSIGFLYVTASISTPGRHHFQQLYDYAKYSWLGALESRSFNNVDILLLTVFVSPTLVGIYAVAWRLATFLTIFGGAIRTALFPEISRSDAEGNRQQVATFVTDGISFNGLFIIPGFVGAVILGERILRVYGSEFEQGIAVLGLLVLAALFHGYQQQLLDSLNAIDKPNLAFRVNAVFIGVNAVANVGLIILFGWVGAAIASVFSTALGMGLAYWTLRRQLDFHTPWRPVGEQVFSAAVMGLGVYGARFVLERSAIGSHNVGLVLTVIFVGVVTYFATLLAVSPTLRTTVRSNLPGWFLSTNQ